jgi:thiamine-phosphate pyrophosphorylase
MLLYYITDRRAFPGTEAQRRTCLLAKIAEAARCGVDFIQLREKDLSPCELERLAREAMQVVRDHTLLESAETATRLLINSRIDIALATGADGVHLTSTDIAASDARAIWARSIRNSKLETRNMMLAVSCHTIDEVRFAEAHGADFAVFAPVFEKSVVVPHVRPARATGRDNMGISLTEDESAVSHPSHEAKGWEERQLIAQRSRDEGLITLKAACQSVAFRNNVEGVGSSTMPILALGGITLDNARNCVKAGAVGIAAIRLFQDNDISEVVRRLS